VNNSHLPKYRTGTPASINRTAANRCKPRPTLHVPNLLNPATRSMPSIPAHDPRREPRYRHSALIADTTLLVNKVNRSFEVCSCGLQAAALYYELPTVDWSVFLKRALLRYSDWGSLV
jgi:hypothetical protein